ncbi:MAG: tetratricopeptide repeat protein [Thermodesulfobacteriota bacterium]|nr:tetratricopeptide repeat protein [Thermodesulfobacteriota bacterium]
MKMSQTVSQLHIALLALGAILFATSCSGEDREQMFNTGNDYFYGNGVAVNQESGCDYYEKSAIMGHPLAQHNLGNCFLNGQGRKIDVDTAASWFKKAANKNVASSKSNLANIYLFEFNDESVYQEAIRLLRDAITQDDLMASLILGLVYFEGIAVEQNIEEARHYETAGNRGHILAQALLFHIYSEGLHGVTVDSDKANYWERQFHKNKDPYFADTWTIDKVLAGAYEKGWGVQRNAGKATFYRNKEKLTK